MGCINMWRSHLTTTANQELRQATWAGLDASLTALPQRCELLICGDFNASLRREPNVVGPSVLAHSSTCDDHLQATYYSATGSSQIDFVVTRQRMSGGPAKHAQPITTFPIGAGRLAGHYPVFATVLATPFFGHPSAHASQPAKMNTAALQQAVRSCIA